MKRLVKRMEERTTKWTIGFLCVLFVTAYAVVTWASPAVGVTATLIGRGTYARFKVNVEEGQNQWSHFHYSAEAKPAADMTVQTHDFAPGSSSGWHTHPGPVFITVTEGALTFYEVDDPTCTPKVITAGEGYVDTGHGHIGRNETGGPAKDVTVEVAPVGSAFRNELPAPGPYCAF